MYKSVSEAVVKAPQNITAPYFAPGAAPAGGGAIGQSDPSGSTPPDPSPFSFRSRGPPKPTAVGPARPPATGSVTPGQAGGKCQPQPQLQPQSQPQSHNNWPVFGSKLK